MTDLGRFVRSLGVDDATVERWKAAGLIKNTKLRVLITDEVVERLWLAESRDDIRRVLRDLKVVTSDAE